MCNPKASLLLWNYRQTIKLFGLMLLLTVFMAIHNFAYAGRCVIKCDNKDISIDLVCLTWPVEGTEPPASFWVKRTDLDYFTDPTLLHAPTETPGKCSADTIIKGRYNKQSDSSPTKCTFFDEIKTAYEHCYCVTYPSTCDLKLEVDN